jgi:MSHA biogenesis protein MshP
MRHKVQRGFSLVTAIFLVVVLTVLGAMMVTFFAAQQQSSAIDTLGSRAYQAARAGIEWGAFQITQSGVVSPQYAFATACQGGTSSVPVTPSTQPTLAGTPLSAFNLVDSCYATTYTEGASSAVIYTITATVSGINGATPGSTDYVQRVMQETIASAVSSDPASGIIYQRESY